MAIEIFYTFYDIATTPCFAAFSLVFALLYNAFSVSHRLLHASLVFCPDFLYHKISYSVIFTTTFLMCCAASQLPKHTDVLGLYS
jgi:hypothetical protein